MRSEIDGVARRTQRYWYEDGFAELVSGGLMVLGGGGLAAAYQVFVGWSAGSPDLATRCLVALLVVGTAQALAVIAGRAMRGGIEAAKERITYPRTGYVAYRQPQPKKRSLPEQLAAFVLVFMVSLLAGAAMGALLSHAPLPAWLISMPMSLAAVIAIALVVLARQMALARFYGLAGASLLAGWAAALGDLAFVGTMLYLTFMGLILLVSGGVTLWRYTRRNAPPDFDAEDDHDE